jgi:hypothetical protein
MSGTTQADQPIAFYNIPGNDMLRVAELKPGMDNQAALAVHAEGVAQVLHNSWTTKFVNSGLLLSHEVDNTLKTPYQQQKAINETWIENRTAIEVGRVSKAARYLVTSFTGYEAPTDPSDIRAVLRIEPYSPKLPTIANMLREPYPKITDLETRGGTLLDGDYKWDALVLMRAALQYSNPYHKVAAYTERENPDGLDFFAALGFKDRQHDQAVAVGSRPGPHGGPAVRPAIHYVHMEARRAAVPLDTLCSLIDKYVVR